MGIIQTIMKNKHNEEKIDLVYTWVDNTDKNWQKEKQKYEKEYNILSSTNDECRYINNNELKYSLRSVAKFAPWINHIYIVTAGQTPSWLNTNNPKLSVISHEEIFPKDTLPTFNSRSIEHCLVNIPNLSEKFLYANDDCFFYRAVTPDFFFKNSIKPIYRYRNKIELTYTSLFTRCLIKLNELTYKKYKKKYMRFPHHNIDPYTKTIIKKCYAEFKNEIDATINNRFRTENDIQRFVYHSFACAKNLGVYKVIHKIDSDLPLYKQIYNRIKKRYEKDSIFMRINNLESKKEELELFRPKLVCFNDAETATNDDRVLLKQFLESLFPEKSDFEI